jgi:uncharacterized protein (DUF433 family)
VAADGNCVILLHLKEWNMPDLPDPLVSSRPDWMSGTPCFHGTRVPVKNLFDYLAGGHPLDDFLADFPSVTRDHVLAVIALASAKVAAVPQAA